MLLYKEKFYDKSNLYVESQGYKLGGGDIHF